MTMGLAKRADLIVERPKASTSRLAISLSTRGGPYREL